MAWRQFFFSNPQFCLVDYFKTFVYLNDMDEKLKHLASDLLLEKSHLQNKLYRLRKEMEFVQSALEKIESTFSMLAQHFPDIRNIETKSKRPKTVGDMALEVLKKAPNGLKASEILERIQKTWIPDLARTSLSPPLSRLKKQGLVKYNNGFWRLAETPHHNTREED